MIKPMESQLLKKLLTFSLIALMLAGCNNQGKKQKGTTSDGKQASVEVEVFDPVKIRDQIIEVIQRSPKGVELVDFLNQAGASYILDLTTPFGASEKMMTTTSKALGIGMYGFDLKYASVYNRGDIAAKLKDFEIKLINDLGLNEDLDIGKKYGDRIEKNQSNKDSLKELTNQLLNDYHQQMVKGKQPGAYALTTIGGNIEALYVLSQMALLSKNNTRFLELMSNQQERIKSLSQLLELMSGDETVKPYYESMKPIVQFFEQNKTIGDPELKKIAPEIEKVRNIMIQ
jgi:hypothetical protein